MMNIEPNDIVEYKDSRYYIRSDTDLITYVGVVLRYDKDISRYKIIIPIIDFSFCAKPDEISLIHKYSGKRADISTYFQFFNLQFKFWCQLNINSKLKYFRQIEEPAYRKAGYSASDCCRIIKSETSKMQDKFNNMRVKWIDEQLHNGTCPAELLDYFKKALQDYDKVGGTQ